MPWPSDGAYPCDCFAKVKDCWGISRKCVPNRTVQTAPTTNIPPPSTGVNAGSSGVVWQTTKWKILGLNLLVVGHLGHK